MSVTREHVGGKSENELKPPVQLLPFIPVTSLTSHFRHHLKTLTLDYLLLISTHLSSRRSELKCHRSRVTFSKRLTKIVPTLSMPVHYLVHYSVFSL